jgi:outer membrane protein assembly factor BamB
MGYGSLQGYRPEGVVASATELDTRLPITDILLLSKENGAVLQSASHHGYWDARTNESSVYLSSTDQAAMTEFGKQERKWETDLPLSAGGNVAALPFAIIGETMYVSTKEGLFVVDCETGDIVFKYTEIGQIEAITVANEQLFVASGQTVHALSAGNTKVYD